MAVRMTEGFYPGGYRTNEINRGLHVVRKGKVTIGQVRRGLDGHWYAELLPGEGFRTAAIQRLILAHEAMVEFEEAVGGQS